MTSVPKVQQNILTRLRLYEERGCLGDSERFLLYLIGNKEELNLGMTLIAKEKIQETYLRPLDVKLLAVF